MDLEGFEPSPATMARCCAAITPQAHAESFLHYRALMRPVATICQFRVFVPGTLATPPSENANGPGIPEAVATANNSFPAKVTLLLSKQSSYKSSYFKERRTPSANSPLVPERHSFTRKEWNLEGFEPSPNTLMGYRAAVTPRAHARSLGRRGAPMHDPIALKHPDCESGRFSLG
jgi:hypothetical protein